MVVVLAGFVVFGGFVVVVFGGFVVLGGFVVVVLGGFVVFGGLVVLVAFVVLVDLVRVTREVLVAPPDLVVDRDSALVEGATEVELGSSPTSIISSGSVSLAFMSG